MLAGMCVIIPLGMGHGTMFARPVHHIDLQTIPNQVVHHQGRCLSRRKHQTPTHQIGHNSQDQLLDPAPRGRKAMEQQKPENNNNNNNNNNK